MTTLTDHISATAKPLFIAVLAFLFIQPVAVSGMDHQMPDSERVVTRQNETTSSSNHTVDECAEVVCDQCESNVGIHPLARHCGHCLVSPPATTNNVRGNILTGSTGRVDRNHTHVVENDHRRISNAARSHPGTTDPPPTILRL